MADKQQGPSTSNTGHEEIPKLQYSALRAASREGGARDSGAGGAHVRGRGRDNLAARFIAANVIPGAALE